MKILKIKKNKNKHGFIILFAVTLSAILLSVALGVANVSFKEVSFSVSASDSNDSFLAADTGAECALFHDKLSGSSFPLDGVGRPAIITCAGQPSTLVYTPVSSNVGVYNFVVSGLGSSSNSCAKVEVRKDKSQTPVNVVVTSTGYNIGDSTCTSSNNRRVERELVVSSKIGSTPVYVPPPSTVDLKLNGADCPAVDPCGVASGSTVTLTWSTTSITANCTASSSPAGLWSGSKNWAGAINPNTPGPLTTTTTFTLTCPLPGGAVGTVADSVVASITSAVPTVTSPTVTGITTTGATLGANVTSLGSPASISARGTCYGTTPNPTTNCVAQGGTTTGVFTHARSGLASGTFYYYRGYATNASGTGYSPDGTFTTTSAPCIPTGGTIADSGGYRTHTFTTSGTFTSTCTKSVYYIVVAGGGGGGSAVGPETQGGGGGAGGVLSTYSTPYNLPANSYAITVGAGGGVNGNGGNSSIAGIATAIGGGRGGSGAGGSGGGTSGVNGLNSGVGGAGTAGQGYKGGDGIWGGGEASRGSGGGGAGGVGQPPVDGWDGGAGGVGVTICLAGCATYSQGGGGGYGSYAMGGIGSGGGGEHNTPWPFEANPAPGVAGVVKIIYAYP